MKLEVEGIKWVVCPFSLAQGVSYDTSLSRSKESVVINKMIFFGRGYLSIASL
jgi:hypothetical protein